MRLRGPGGVGANSRGIEMDSAQPEIAARIDGEESRDGEDDDRGAFAGSCRFPPRNSDCANQETILECAPNGIVP